MIHNNCAKKDDEMTLTECLACGGQWKFTIENSNGTYKVDYCKHCLRGGMTSKQQIEWNLQKQKRLESGVREKVNF